MSLIPREEIDHHAPGAKNDSGKNRLGLVLCGFSRSLIEVGKVGTFGAGKYSDGGWVNVQNGEQRYTDALLRHLFASAMGENTDTESGLSHWAHVAWNALAVLDFMIRETEQRQNDE